MRGKHINMALNKPRLLKGLEALRSGNYAQGVGALRSSLDEPEKGVTVEHCCLGVLTDVARKDPEFKLCDSDLELLQAYAENAQRDPDTYAADPEVIWIVEGDTLSESVRKYYGFDDHNPSLKVVGPFDNGGGATEDDDGVWWLDATTANDDRRWNFPEIADAFERTYIQADDAARTTD
jgi:hypothetical protein